MSRKLSRRQVVRGGALVAGLVVGGCRWGQLAAPTGQPPTTTAAPATAGGRPTLEPQDVPWRTESVMDPFRQLLARRAKAVLARDEQGFLAGLDQSNPALIEQERLVFANLAQLEFSDFRFDTGSVHSGTFRDEEGNHVPDVAVYTGVIEIAQLSIDTGPGGVAPGGSYRYELDTSDDTDILVRDITPITRAVAEELDFDVRGVYANAPWNTTPLRVVQAGNVWLAGDDSVPDLETFAAAAEAEAGKVEALWGDRTRFPGYILFFSRDTGSLETWFDAGFLSRSGVAVFEGLQLSLQGVRINGRVYNGEYAGSRIVVNLASTELAGDDPVYVMRHELTHAVTARATSVNTGNYSVGSPRWALEGFALWVEVLDSPARQDRQRAVVAEGVRAGVFTGRPPASRGFYGPHVAFNYTVSATLFSFIEQARDRDTAVEFYARVIEHEDTRRRQLIDDRQFDDICEEVLGTGPDAFFQQWAGFVRGGA